VLDVLRVDQPDLKAVFQDSKDRLPIDPGTLDDDMRAAQGYQPVRKVFEFMGHRSKGSDLFVGLPLCIDTQAAGHEELASAHPVRHSW
jgi:hypothetical protein